MATHTTNFNLSKPDPTDTQSSFISEYCNNMNIIDEHLGQGGGGSSVSWQQLQVTGDKIATIRVSGIPQDVFAPNSQTFSMAISRANINSDEKYSTIFGKIKKWFADLKAVAFSGSYNDLSNTPTKVSDFTNDSGFVTSTVNNLANYYLKSETYTQAQVDALIGAISTISIEVVQSLPTQDIKTNTIYLVPKQTAGTQNVYDEYIYVNNAWELIGDTEIDLSNYVTTTDLATALQDYVTSTGLSTILANYYTSSQVDTLLGGKVNDVTVNGTSVVNQQGVAEITVPDDLADLSDDSTHRTVTDTEKSTWSAKVSDNPTFTEASTRANIASGESFATILGKIKKFFTDLKSVAFSGAYADLSGTPTKLSDFTDDVGYLESSDITVTQVQSTGTKIATIDVDGTSTDLYAPAGGGGGSVNDVTVNGTSVVNAQGVAEVITSDRVAKSGDTMSGALTIQNIGDSIVLNRANSNTFSSWIVFKNSSGVIGQYSVDQNGRPRYIANNDSSDIKQIALTSDIPSSLPASDVYAWAKAPTKPSYTHNEIGEGVATIGNGQYAILMRTQAKWKAGMYYHTTGDEAMVFGNQNARTSWIFANTNPEDRTAWTSLSPAMHIKNGKVAIGKLIADGSYLTYPLEVNGDVLATNFRGALIGNADTATKANLLKYLHNNEINFSGGRQPNCYFNYRDADTDAENSLGAINYYFCDYSRASSNSVLYAKRFAGTADNATKFNGLSANFVATNDKTKISVTISRTSFAGNSGFLKVMGDGNGSGIDFLIPVHSGSVGTPVGHWVVAPSPQAGYTSTEVSVQINVTQWNFLYVITGFEVLRITPL